MIPQNRSFAASVALVGAGPGDPQLVTLRGFHLLQNADVVLFDGLCNPAILDFAPQAEKICVGKHGRLRIWTQAEINDEMIAHAQRGKRVVRLKGGDPAVFARTSEEIAALREAGLRFEIVPGITAALAASSFAGVPVTDRGLASAVALVTGHEEPGKSESALDWQALAKFPGTLVIYMGVTTVESWTNQLLANGKAPDTPVAILRRCSLPDQQSVFCRLDQVSTALTPASKMRPPVIVIIGPVATLAHDGSWFSRRPLFGQRVMITRAEGQTDELRSLLADLGAEPVLQPAIQIEPLAPGSAEYKEFEQQLLHASTFDWIVFSSRNAVDAFFTRLFELHRDTRILGGVQIAAVGKGTSQQLRKYGVIADHVPERFSASALLQELDRPMEDQRVLLPRASRGTDTLLEGFTKLGATVIPVTAYLHLDVSELPTERYEQMAASQIHWTTVTSNAIAHSLVNLFGESLHHTRLASLSPGVSSTLQGLGFPPTVEATSPAMSNLCQAILDHASSE